MIHSSDTLISTDPATLVDLCYTAEKQVYLSFRRHTPYRCFLPSPCLADMLQDIADHGLVGFRLQSNPTVPGLATPAPFIAYVSSRDRLILAYVPLILDDDDASALFDTFPKLPLVVCPSDVLANRKIYNRVMADPARN